MPAGAVCPCGTLTTRPSKRCENCERSLERRRSIRDRIYASKAWRAARKAAWLRDRYTCTVCGHSDPGNRNRTLDAHHTISIDELLATGRDPFDIAWVATMCKRCHGRVGGQRLRR
jgi:5-methylcytosine-specific restriction endonuclease McrA